MKTSQYILSLMQDVETANRGYAITKNESFKEPFHNAINSVDSAFLLLKSMTTDTLGQQQLLDTLGGWMDKKISITEKIMAMVDTLGTQAAQEYIARGEAK